MISKSTESTELDSRLHRLLDEIFIYKQHEYSLQYIIQKRLDKSVVSYAAELDEAYDTLSHLKSQKSERKILKNI